LFDALEFGLGIPFDVEAHEIARAKERDSATWSAWYDRYFPLLYKYVYARTGRPEDAEDIAAQAFVKALENIDGFKYRGTPVLAWLYRITGNLLTDKLRKERRRNTIPLDAIVVEIDEGNMTETRVELSEALGRLKREQREVIVLRYLLSLSVGEIAVLLGKKEAAVYSLHLRAVANLRKALRR
jgi:RNA polymerase sigma-70 factor (ECF subfamily)